MDCNNQLPHFNQFESRKSNTKQLTWPISHRSETTKEVIQLDHILLSIFINVFEKSVKLGITHSIRAMNFIIIINFLVLWNKYFLCNRLYAPSLHTLHSRN